MSSTWSVEVESPVAAPRLFKAVLLDWHNLAPKLVPEIVLSASAVQVDGGVGSVRHFNFSPALPFSFVKERLDFLDVEKCELKQSLIEGGGLGEKIESAASHFKFEATGNGGCVCKVVATYKPIPGVEVTEDDIAKGKESIVGTIKAAEGYLVANPDAYA